MEIIENKALLFRTRQPHKYDIIPRKVIVEQYDEGAAIMVKWGLDEVRVLRNLGLRKAPSPITGRYSWPGRYTPMAHQIETASFLTLHRRAFVFNDPGTGKTLSALWAADYLMRIGQVRRVLILCPLSIMHSAWMGDLQSSIIHRSAVIAHHSDAERRRQMVRSDYEFVISNYEGVEILAKDIIKDGRFDLVIVDECFVAGTLVSTPLGRRPIEQLVAGDKVLTSDGVMRINRLVRNTATQLVEVRLGNGESIKCTPEHPFFTDAGWVCAKNLAGRRLISGVELSYLRAGISPQSEPCVVGYGEQPTPWVDLLQILRTEEMACLEPGQKRLQQDGSGAEREALGAQNSGAPSEAVGGCQGERASPENSQRQRDRHDAYGVSDFRGLACGVGMELPGSVGAEAARLSYELQARLCMAKPEGRSRSGRRQPHLVCASTARPEERSEAGGAWVESVSYIECPGGEAVYNLEVAGTPNYFVGGHWLVHNCNAYKNPSTHRWKALDAILTKDTYLWMMTGSPASQSPEDAFGLARLVCPNRVPLFKTAWRDRVMYKLTKFKWVPKPNAKELVFDALQPAIRFKKSDCLDLPPVVTETRFVEMTAQQKRYYNLLKEQALVRAAGETITAVNAAAEVSKLLQISAGAAYSDNSEIVEFDATPRMRVLEEVLNETERKVIVFALFRASIAAIVAHLTKEGIPVEEIHGDVKPSKRGEIIQRFQTQPEPRILVMQPQATAHGITLTAADHVVFFGPLMSVEQYTQAIARSDRKGQTSDKVTVTHIQSSPIEEKMFKALVNRVDDNRLLTDMFKAEIG